MNEQFKTIPIDVITAECGGASVYSEINDPAERIDSRVADILFVTANMDTDLCRKRGSNGAFFVEDDHESSLDSILGKLRERGGDRTVARVTNRALDSLHNFALNGDEDYVRDRIWLIRDDSRRNLGRHK